MATNGSATILQVGISATFTAEPIEPYLSFWLNRAGLPAQIRFAPYHQIFQQLLAPTSVLKPAQETIKQTYANVLLIRLSDWMNRQPDDGDGASEESVSLLDTVASFTEGLKKAVEDTGIAYVVAICPSEHSAGNNGVGLAEISSAEEALILQCQQIDGVICAPSQEIVQRYSVPVLYDPVADRAGHVPYSAAGFAAIAAAVGRRISAQHRPPYKVVVLDCDNTLWHGVCGEDGPEGVQVSGPWRSLQEVMIRQFDKGMLLCLNSKNIEADVWAVFDENPGMLLQREHIVTTRINWEPKSLNLRSLAEELNLGLDSFLFIDDNPVECAEVKAHCPDVTTLLLPEDPDAIPSFLDRIWPLDQFKVTEADQKRAAHYRGNVQRNQLRDSAGSLRGFLESLDLQIDIAAPEKPQLARMAQLTQRTNQFNATGRRRTEPELSPLLRDGELEGRIVSVQDRFGDYGIVGVLLFDENEDAIRAESFMLSCRALGRGVEQQMLMHLGQVARARNFQYVDVDFKNSDRNEPIELFLKHAGSPEFSSLEGERGRFRFHIDAIQALDPVEAHPATKKQAAKPAATATIEVAHSVSPSERWMQIASKADMNAVVASVQAGKQPRPDVQTPMVAPQTELEIQIKAIWEDVLSLETVSTEDSFKELGGTSLHLVQIYSRLRQIVDLDFPLTQLFTLPTIRTLAAALSTDASSGRVEDSIKSRAARQKAAMQKRRNLRLKNS